MCVEKCINAMLRTYILYIALQTYKPPPQKCDNRYDEGARVKIRGDEENRNRKYKNHFDNNNNMTRILL